VLRSDSTRIHSPYLVNEEPYSGCSHTTPLALEVHITPSDQALLHILSSRPRPLDAPSVLPSLSSELQGVRAAGFFSPRDGDSKNATRPVVDEKYVRCRNGRNSAMSALWIERSTRSVCEIFRAWTSMLPRMHRWRA
jgi:hypothetical protein